MLVLLATIAISAKFQGGILYLGLVQLLRRLRCLAKGSQEAFEAVLPSNPAQFVERLTNCRSIEPTLSQRIADRLLLVPP